VALRHEVRERHPDYHAAPVAAWGSKRSRLLIVGLAPGLHGANRTGRPFTGDASGAFLFRGLHAFGFASAPDANRAQLRGARITNALKCLPPENRPLAGELGNCRPYLQAELEELLGRRPRRPRVILGLGRLAFEAVGRALEAPPVPFAHGASIALARNAWLIASYHPSRQNTNTGRLTEAMLDDVLAAVRDRLASRAPAATRLPI
jgi:uracil-DNA glycosylase family 4